MKKKVLSLLLASAMVVSLAACGSKDNGTAASQAPAASSQAPAASSEAAPEVKEVTVPESLSILVDGTLVATNEEGIEQFKAKLQELTGIKNITFIQPDHKEYYNNVSQLMASADKPDVLLLGSTYYASYAAAGVLWDMTDAYNASELKARHEAKGSSIYVDSLRINDRLYGMAHQKGGGCATYVRQSWLDAAGITTLPTNFDEYLAMLRAFKASGVGAVDDYVIGAAGFVGGEAPYINYWPEFYQDAYPTFVQQADGTWVDGFTQDSMKAAITRLRDAVAEGLIDKQSLDQGTGDARNKFAGNEYGVFTYWANYWATNLKNNIAKADKDADPTIVALPPIKEVGTYINRLSTCWCITDDGDGDDSRELAIFKYFIETMQDGGETQFLWTYGVEGTHYSYAAETLWAGDEKKEKTYEEGKFHWLPMLSDGSKAYSKMHISYADALVELKDAPQGLEPDAEAVAQMFLANCRNEALTPQTDAYAKYNGNLTKLKNDIIANVVVGNETLEEGYARFVSESGQDMSDAIVASLNALN